MSFFNDVYGDRDLSARTKTVCLYLHDRANSEGESWYAIGTIAADLGLSRSTVKRALNDLVRLGRVKNSLPTKGRLRQLTGPGAGSLRPTQKVPEEGLLSSENRNTFLS